MNNTAAEYDKTYGIDYAYLGCRPQYIAAILAMGESIREVYPQDYVGTSIDELTIMDSIINYDQIATLISIADGSRTTDWVEYGGRYNLTVIGAVTAAMVTTYDPYLASGQINAMMGGLRGAAEYEKLLEISGGGARGMLAQSSAHIYVIFLIIVGNIIYFKSRKKGRGN